MKMKAYASFDKYLAAQKPKHRVIIRALRRFVKKNASSLRESVKWGNGCWVGKVWPVCYVYAGPEYVQFGFMAGSKLKDPKKLLLGSGAWVRHLKVANVSDINPKEFRALLKQAVRRGHPAE